MALKKEVLCVRGGHLQRTAVQRPGDSQQEGGMLSPLATRNKFCPLLCELVRGAEIQNELQLTSALLAAS